MQLQSELTAFARKHNVSYRRAQQIEIAALSKLSALLMGEEIDTLDREELRLLVVHTRNALKKRPRHPAEVVREFKERGTQVSDDAFQHGR
jgi:hypothetical protein